VEVSAEVSAEGWFLGDGMVKERVRRTVHFCRQTTPASSAFNHSK